MTVSGERPSGPGTIGGSDAMRVGVKSDIFCHKFIRAALEYGYGYVQDILVCSRQRVTTIHSCSLAPAKA